MLKITQIEPNILQLHSGYLKTFLIVMGIAFLSFVVLFIFSYQHVSIKANRSENTLLFQRLSFFSGSESQKIKLSEVQEMRPNLSSKDVATTDRTSGGRATYERPSIKMKNGEEFFLLKRSRSVLYVSKLFRKFNRFLKGSQENTFSQRTVYMGIIWEFIV